ncbi:MAG: ABC transporter ATP-binding protein/permease [Galactobacillus timonensis]|uniref:ABC transporter ATP-binding protein n=1 Tax=Galactobacillus timonensis TaxID=2041840 RepID=UPI0023F00DBB|nr:ABC transporter ATP-binding protein [Galactobacillus timonensis]MCI6066827.1 ABC transporter ATP-binding protein/permease [Galactobacillus timonensis]MCI6753619.1 ABC transporter ATP-binding protein/permease [Galactobacillus timonensis]MDD7087536.1 ABC transporter ATP-binding protein [Galactobacillus timonensis]MDY5222302.1 ABC transporter ATP-binding protein [Lachnospiraceae bacterium]
MSENRKQRPPMGHGRPMGTGEKAKDFKGTTRRLLAYMRPYRFQLIFICIFAVISTIFSIVGPKILGNATTLLAEGLAGKYTSQGSIDFAGIFRILRNLTIIYLLSALFNYLSGWMMAGVTQKITYSLREEISKKINRLPLNYFDRQTHGEVLSRVTNDVDTVSQSLNQAVQQVLTSLITIIGILYMMLRISWQMTLMAIIVIPISGILAAVIVKKSQKYFLAQQSTLGRVNGHIEEMYGGHLVMKAFNGEERSISTFNRLNNDLYESAWKSQFISGIMMPVTSFIGNVGYVGVCILGGYLAIHGNLAIGDIQAFIQYVRNFNQPITQTAQIMNVMQSTAAAAERVFEFLEEPEAKPDTDHPVSIRDADGNLTIRGDVAFENVCFGYEPDKIVIHDFSAFIKAGQQIAIVGPTGAGKTTIVKLLMRFYDLNSGTIYIDGIDTRNLTRKDLRDCFGMVLQDAWLHTGTIMENIRYGKLDATDEEVVKAADAAYVDHFIRTLENGYQTEINEETTNISQGQKQLLTIARAFLADPKILILDEATSSVDTRTEILIQKGMENLMKGRTSFVIAHRLSTIRNADLILVMDHGDIVEAGKHEELLTKNGFYAKLYNAQFEES